MRDGIGRHPSAHLYPGRCVWLWGGAHWPVVTWSTGARAGPRTAALQSGGERLEAQWLKRSGWDARLTVGESQPVGWGLSARLQFLGAMLGTSVRYFFG